MHFLNLSGMKARLCRAVLFSLLGAGAIQAQPFSFRFFHFRPVAIRSGSGSVHLSEFTFYNGTTPVTGATVTDPTDIFDENAHPEYATDGDLTTRWADGDFQKGNLVFDFGQQVTIDSYNFATDSGDPGGDPVSWVIEGCNDFSSDDWTVIDIVGHFDTPTGRKIQASPTNFILPVVPPGIVEHFDFSDPWRSMIVLNGSQVDLAIDTAYATTVTLTPSSTNTAIPIAGAEAGTVYTVSPPPNALTKYVLNAQSAGGSNSAGLSVRTVAGASLNYRYLRFTPKELVNGKNVELRNFEFRNGDAPVPVVAVESPDSVDSEGSEVANLIDDPSASTSWWGPDLARAIFDMGASRPACTGYSFTSGGVAGAPLKWLIEGSNDKASWTLVENVNFDFNTPKTQDIATDTIPFPGASLLPYATISSSVRFAEPGKPFTLSWNVGGATTVSISPGIGTVAASGTISIVPSAAATYTVTGTNPNGSSQASVTVPVFATGDGTFAFSNFSDHSQFVLNGSAKILNDYPHFTAAGDVQRLRLTDLVKGERSSAWYHLPVSLKDGFEANFDAMIAGIGPNDIPGDQISFVIQNNPGNTAAVSTDQANLDSNAVSISLISYPDLAGLRIYSGRALKQSVDLGAFGMGIAHGLEGFFLGDISGAAAQPYHVRVVYASGKLSVYVDGVLAVDSLPLDLTAEGALDGNGRGFVGFIGNTGDDFVQYGDVTSFTLQPSAVTVTGPVLVSSSFNVPAHQLALTWTSVAGKNYRITQSSDLTTWTPLSSGNISATAAQTSATVTYPAATKGFFRVELVN